MTYISFSFLSRKLQFSTEDAECKSFKIQVLRILVCLEVAQSAHSHFNFRQPIFVQTVPSLSDTRSLLAGWGLTHVQVGLFVLGP